MTNDNMGVLRQLAIAVLADRLYILGSDQWADPELVARWNAEITPTTILELTRELAAARADATRYRWIRDNHEVRGRAMEIVYGMNGDDWDAAIDAALAGEKRNGL